MIFLNIIDDENVRNCLEMVYTLYKKELHYISYGILKDYHEAEDVVQTAIIKFADYVDDQLDVNCHKTKGLIVIIVRNLSINIYKQRKNRKMTDYDALAEHIQDEKIMSPETNILRLDQSHEIAKKISEINKSYADILTLKYTYEYSNTEIASLLSISEDNVRKRLSRAKRALKKIIEGGENHE